MNADGEKIAESEKESKKHELRQSRNLVLIDVPINKLNKDEPNRQLDHHGEVVVPMYHGVLYSLTDEAYV